ncbi:MAG: hypothetical protein ABSE81_01560 [Candidatus Omnitrophota bacterium]|jgi:hypothetical protein
MKIKDRIIKYLSAAIFLIAGLSFIAKFGGPQILKYYVQTGIGDCERIPIFCMSPYETIDVSKPNSAYMAELVPYKAYKISAYVPKGFNVVQELIMKTSFKKHKRMFKGDIIYMLCQDKDFFTRLYPQLKKEGVNDNYEFIRRVMYAKEDEINNITDTFFVIMKGIFIPDIGNQLNAKMIRVNLGGFKGFINYNMEKTGNYFDCNVVDGEGKFFKVYIKDKSRVLNLEKVFTILSTVKCIDAGILLPR